MRRGVIGYNSSALTLALALLARLVGRLWDAWDAWAASGSGSGDRGGNDRGRSRGGATRSGGRLAVGVPRPVLVALLVTSVMCGLAWLSYVLGQVDSLG